MRGYPARLRRAGATALVAVVGVLALGAQPAGANSFVSLSFSRFLIDFDNVGEQDQLTIKLSPSDPTRIRFEDSAGVTVSGDLEPGSCPVVETNAAECVLQVQRTSVSVNVPGKLGPTPDVIDASASPRALRIGDRAATANEVNVTGSAFNDIISLAAGIEVSEPSSVLGGEGSDIVNGSAENDTIDGGGGGDSISGLGGNDQLTGGAADDALTGGGGGDTMGGGPGSDIVHYEDHAAGVDVTVGAGAGNDGNAQDGTAGSRDTVTDAEVVVGTAADDSLHGDAAANQLTGGAGDDVLAGGAGDDALDGGAGANTASYADHGAAVTVNLADAGADGAAGEADTLAGIRDLVGGSGDDTLVGDAAPNVIRGGSGKDIVIGQAGGDHLFGEADNDDVRAKDNETDNVDCGEGADKASLDDIDLAAGCDDATITVVDADGDGAPIQLDCNDADPSVHPGAVDVPGDGIDQDCAGGDARVDADGDGIFREQDCNDADAAIRPGAIEIPGNGVDENCDGIKAPFPKLDVGLSSGYALFARYTLLTDLAVSRAPAGTTIVVRCRSGGKRRSACPFKSRTVKLQEARRKVSFKRAFDGRRLRPGTTITLTVRAPGMIGRVLVLTVRARKRPSKKVTCADPAGTTVAC